MALLGVVCCSAALLLVISQSVSGICVYTFRDYIDSETFYNDLLSMIATAANSMQK